MKLARSRYYSSLPCGEARTTANGKLPRMQGMLTHAENSSDPELLISFFKSSMPLLNRGGAIIVTLFQGEPYTLWNVRDLARHVGLKLQRSLAFKSDDYPGYQHARTLGVVRGGGGGGAWKGENREARTFMFQSNQDG